MDKKIINDAIELTDGISGSDVLTPLNQEEINLTPYPEIEFDVIVETTLDKFKRKLNDMSENWRHTEWGMNVVQTPVGMKFYQLMCRWNVDANIGPKPEMPSKNSETGGLGPNAPLWEGMKFLENEEDLYEDINKDETNWNSVAW